MMSYKSAFLKNNLSFDLILTGIRRLLMILKRLDSGLRCWTLFSGILSGASCSVLFSLVVLRICGFGRCAVSRLRFCQGWSWEGTVRFWWHGNETLIGYCTNLTRFNEVC